MPPFQRTKATTSASAVGASAGGKGAMGKGKDKKDNHNKPQPQTAQEEQPQAPPPQSPTAQSKQPQAPTFVSGGLLNPAAEETPQAPSQTQAAKAEPPELLPPGSPFRPASERPPPQAASATTSMDAASMGAQQATSIGSGGVFRPFANNQHSPPPKDDHMGPSQPSQAASSQAAPAPSSEAGSATRARKRQRAAGGARSLRRRSPSAPKRGQPPQEDITQLLMSLAIGHRELQGAIFDFYVVPSDSSLISAMEAQSQAWSQVVEDHKNGDKASEPHPFGAPYLQVYVALVEAFAKHPAVPTPTQAELAHMADEHMRDDELSLMVRSCKIMTTYKQEVKKMQRSLMDRRARKLVCQAMKMAGAYHRTGRFPANQA